MNAPHLLRLTALAFVVAFPAQTVAQSEQSPGAGEHNPDLMDEVSRVDFGKDIKPIFRDLCVRCPIDVKVVVQCIMRFDHAARLAMGSRERWETGLRVVDWTGDQLRVLRPLQRSGWRALAAR